MCLTNSIWAGEFHLQKTLMKMLPQHDFLLLLLLSSNDNYADLIAILKYIANAMAMYTGSRESTS